jgi:hypothetical protein
VLLRYLIEVTSHPLATADLQIREPRKPLPPATTRRFLTLDAISGAVTKATLELNKQLEPILPWLRSKGFKRESSRSSISVSIFLGVLTSFLVLVTLPIPVAPNPCCRSPSRRGRNGLFNFPQSSLDQVNTVFATTEKEEQQAGRLKSSGAEQTLGATVSSAVTDIRNLPSKSPDQRRALPSEPRS